MWAFNDLGRPQATLRLLDEAGPPEDDFESGRIAWIPVAEIPALVSCGQICSGTTLAALLYAIAR